jgi:hypothetical protein
MADVDVSAPERDFIATEGDSFPLTVERLKDDGTAWDITDWTFWLTLKESPSDADADATVGPKTNTSHADPTNGITNFELAPSETADLHRRYYYDVQQKRPDGSVKTVLYGTIYFEQDVTETTS